MKPKVLEKRQKEIKVRLTESEHQALLERMTGGELATWIRNTCLDEQPNKKRNYKAADPQLLAALANRWQSQSDSKASQYGSIGYREN